MPVYVQDRKQTTPGEEPRKLAECTRVNLIERVKDQSGISEGDDDNVVLHVDRNAKPPSMMKEK